MMRVVGRWLGSQFCNTERKKVRIMKNKLLVLAVALLGTSILAHAVTAPNPSPTACSAVPSQVLYYANLILSRFGLHVC
jgi:hypothetical protein